MASLVDTKRGSFIVEVWDDEKEKPPHYIGMVEIKLEEIKAGKEEFILTNPKIKKPGKIRLYSFETIQK
jgi:hypothetical protein